MHGKLRNDSLLVGGPDGVDVADAIRQTKSGQIDVAVLSREIDVDTRQALSEELNAAGVGLVIAGGGPDTVQAVRRGQAQVHALATRLENAGEIDFLELAAFNNGSVGVFRCGPGTSPWEHHPDDDELLYVLEGAVELTVLTEHGAITTLVEPGSAFVVPKGLWHKHHVAERLVEFYATPGGTVHSDAEDPRQGV